MVPARKCTSRAGSGFCDRVLWWGQRFSAGDCYQGPTAPSVLDNFHVNWELNCERHNAQLCRTREMGQKVWAEADVGDGMSVCGGATFCCSIALWQAYRKRHSKGLCRIAPQSSSMLELVPRISQLPREA